MQVTLILAAIYNIAGGLTLLFLLRLIAPLIHFNDSGPGLFRMFVGGTAVLFGVAYIAVFGITGGIVRYSSTEPYSSIGRLPLACSVFSHPAFRSRCYLCSVSGT